MDYDLIIINSRNQTYYNKIVGFTRIMIQGVSTKDKPIFKTRMLDAFNKGFYGTKE